MKGISYCDYLEKKLDENCFHSNHDRSYPQDTLSLTLKMMIRMLMLMLMADEDDVDEDVDDDKRWQ